MGMSVEEYMNSGSIESEDFEFNLWGRRVMYRYHRKSRKVLGRIKYFSINKQKVLVVWDDRATSWCCLSSLEIVNDED